MHYTQINLKDSTSSRDDHANQFGPILKSIKKNVKKGRASIESFYVI
jgi:hypothetical protein